jgi:hypothetical protein
MWSLLGTAREKHLIDSSLETQNSKQFFTIGKYNHNIYTYIIKLVNMINGGRGFTYTCTTLYTVQYSIYFLTFFKFNWWEISHYKPSVVLWGIHSHYPKTERNPSLSTNAIFSILSRKISFSLQFFCFRDPSGPYSFPASLLSLQVTKGKFATSILNQITLSMFRIYLYVTDVYVSDCVGSLPPPPLHRNHHDIFLSLYRTTE